MKNESISIEARTVAQFEEQLACIEHAILQALLDTETEDSTQDTDNRGVLQ